MFPCLCIIMHPFCCLVRSKKERMEWQRRSANASSGFSCNSRVLQITPDPADVRGWLSIPAVDSGKQCRMTALLVDYGVCIYQYVWGLRERQRRRGTTLLPQIPFSLPVHLQLSIRETDSFLLSFCWSPDYDQLASQSHSDSWSKEAIGGQERAEQNGRHEKTRTLFTGWGGFVVSWVDSSSICWMKRKTWWWGFPRSERKEDLWLSRCGMQYKGNDQRTEQKAEHCMPPPNKRAHHSKWSNIVTRNSQSCPASLSPLLAACSPGVHQPIGSKFAGLSLLIVLRCYFRIDLLVIVICLLISSTLPCTAKSNVTLIMIIITFWLCLNIQSGCLFMTWEKVENEASLMNWLEWTILDECAIPVLMGESTLTP